MRIKIYLENCFGWLVLFVVIYTVFRSKCAKYKSIFVYVLSLFCSYFIGKIGLFTTLVCVCYLFYKFMLPDINSYKEKGVRDSEVYNKVFTTFKC